MHKFIAIYNLKIAMYNYPLHIWASLQPSTCSGPSQQMAVHCDCISVSVLGG